MPTLTNTGTGIGEQRLDNIDDDARPAYGNVSTTESQNAANERRETVIDAGSGHYETISERNEFNERVSAVSSDVSGSVYLVPVQHIPDAYIHFSP